MRFFLQHKRNINLFGIDKQNFNAMIKFGRSFTKIYVHKISAFAVLTTNFKTFIGRSICTLMSSVPEATALIASSDYGQIPSNTKLGSNYRETEPLDTLEILFCFSPSY